MPRGPNGERDVGPVGRSRAPASRVNGGLRFANPPYKLSGWVASSIAVSRRAAFCIRFA